MTGDGDAARGAAVEARILAGAVTVAGLLAAFHRAMPQLHALNFSTEGPGPTAALVLVLVTGWTIPLLARDGPRSGRRPALLAAAAGAALAASLVPHPQAAVAAGLAAFVLAAPGLAALVDGLGVRVGASLAAGVLLHQALRALTGGAPLAATGWGQVLALLLAAAVAGAWIALLHLQRAPALPATNLADGAPLAAAVLSQAAFLGSAQAPATWGATPAFAAAAGSAAGLAAGGLAAGAGRTPGRRGVWALGGVLVLAAGDVVLLGAAGGLALAAAQAAVVILVAGAAARGPRLPARQAGALVVAVQVLAVLLLLGIVWAGNWPFVPGGAAFRGQAGPLLLALLILPGLAALPIPAGIGRWGP